MKYGMKRVYRAGWLTKAEQCMANIIICVAAASVVMAAYMAWYCWEAAVWRIMGR